MKAVVLLIPLTPYVHANDIWGGMRGLSTTPGSARQRWHLALVWGESFQDDAEVILVERVVLGLQELQMKTSGFLEAKFRISGI